MAKKASAKKKAQADPIPTVEPNAAMLAKLQMIESKLDRFGTMISSYREREERMTSVFQQMDHVLGSLILLRDNEILRRNSNKKRKDR